MTCSINTIAVCLGGVSYIQSSIEKNKSGHDNRDRSKSLISGRWYYRIREREKENPGLTRGIHMRRWIEIVVFEQHDLDSNEPRGTQR